MNRCLYLTKEHTLYIKNEKMPTLESDQVLVRVRANGICGSDIHYYKDGILGKNVVNNAYIPGHECSGILIEIGENVTNLTIGQNVVIEPGIPCLKCRYCREGRYNLCENLYFLSAPGKNGTLCDYIAVRADMVHVMPENMSFELGAIVEPASIGAHAVGMAGNIKGKSLVIMGGGPIGLFVFQAFRASGGGEVTMVDISQGRLDFAKKIGVNHTFNLATQGEIPGNLADVVVETAGSSITTQQLIRVVKRGGRIVQVGWVDTVPMDISLFINKEITYSASKNTCRDFATVIQWLSDGRIDGGSMISHRFDFDKAVEAFDFAYSHRDKVIKAVIFNE